MIGPEELQSLKITKFIFHVVHQGEEHPVLLDEVLIDGFEDFVLARALDTLKGNQFVFNDGSTTCEHLKGIAKDPSTFVAASKKMAIDFHSRNDKRIKPGVFILMCLAGQNKSLFLIIKYDHERVVRYLIEDKKALLEEIKSGFTQSAEALQKSALVDFEGDGRVIVVDRTVRNDITEFFRGFLNVQRRYASTELNENLKRAVASTIRSHQDDLPLSIRSKWRESLNNIAEKKGDFEVEPFLTSMFGPHATDEVRKTFRGELKKNDIEGEVFSLDPDVLSDTGPVRLRTSEGVIVQMPEHARKTVTWADDANGFTIISIKTIKLIED